MAVADYGRAGEMGEILGIVAPLQEMMLQSWDGALRIFPAWPKESRRPVRELPRRRGLPRQCRLVKGPSDLAVAPQRKRAPCKLLLPLA